MAPPDTERIDLGIIGGTGFYRFFAQQEECSVTTEFGDPSAPVTLVEWQGKRIGFIPRHGRHHEHLPHRVPYPANLVALRDLGARQILGFNVVGSLNPAIQRSHFVLIDQFIDLTWGRAWTIFDGDGGAHADTAHPYCPRLRAVALQALAATPEVVHPTATALVINGPRFQTRAENRWFTTVGADVINMTQSTEAAVARELELCYFNVSYCTDYGVIPDDLDPGSAEPPILHDDIVAEFQRNAGRIEQVVAEVVRALPVAVPVDADCRCQRALDGCRVRRP